MYFPSFSIYTQKAETFKIDPFLFYIKVKTAPTDNLNNCEVAMPVGNILEPRGVRSNHKFHQESASFSLS